MRSAGIDPNRSYTYAELTVVSGLPARKISREVEEYQRIGYIQIGTERGRKARAP